MYTAKHYLHRGSVDIKEASRYVAHIPQYHAKYKTEACICKDDTDEKIPRNACQDPHDQEHQKR